MRKKLAIAAAVIVVLIAGFLVFVAGRPDTFSVSRSIAVNAPPDRVFPHINNLHKWQAWSPYEKKDPKMQRTFSGPEEGIGSIYEWKGNDEVGSGRMEIVESKPPNLVTMKLDFLTPFEGHNKAEFKMEPSGQTTNVSWTIAGPVPFECKIVHLIFDMNKMIGGDFEAGLKSLKELAEKPEAESNAGDNNPAENKPAADRESK